MLANLLSTPPNRWVMVEPRLANGTTGNDLLAQAASMGLPISDEEWSLRSGESPTDRVRRVLVPRLAGLDRWGLKEVRPDLLGLTVERLDPRSTIVLVRDLRDVALSLIEKTRHDAEDGYDEDWLRQYLSASPTAVLELLETLSSKRHRVVRYEDLVRDDGVRAELASWLDWPLDGQPGRNLAEVFNRSREVDLHGSDLTDRSVGRRVDPNDKRANAVIDWVEREHGAFQQRFGYR